MGEIPYRAGNTRSRCVLVLLSDAHCLLGHLLSSSCEHTGTSVSIRVHQIKKEISKGDIKGIGGKKGKRKVMHLYFNVKM